MNPWLTRRLLAPTLLAGLCIGNAGAMDEGLSYEKLVAALPERFGEPEISPEQLMFMFSHGDAPDPPVPVLSSDLDWELSENGAVIRGGEHEYRFRELEPSGPDCIVDLLNLSSLREEQKSQCVRVLVGTTEVQQWLWVSVGERDTSRFRYIAPKLPVHNTSLVDACEFSSQLSSLLDVKLSPPTAKTWEYIATVGKLDDSVRPQFGPPVNGPGWNRDSDEGIKPRPVGQLEANNLGFYDVWGNVAEWTVSDDGCDAPVGVIKDFSWTVPASEFQVVGQQRPAIAQLTFAGFRLMHLEFLDECECTQKPK